MQIPRPIASTALLALSATAAAQSWDQTLPAPEVELDLVNPVVATDTYLAVGHPRRDIYFQGQILDEVFVYELAGGSWTEVAVLLAPQPVPSAGSFGASLAMEGDLLAVGDPGAFGPNGVQGAVHLYRRAAGSGWTLEQTVLPETIGLSALGFGTAIDLAGGRLVVGAPTAITASGALENGSVYVFEAVGGAFAEVQRLDGPTAVLFAMFGFALDLDGPDRLLVGQLGGFEAGRAVLFEDQGAGFAEVHAFVSTQPGFMDGFGRSVALEGPRAAVGAPTVDLSQSNDGEVHVFEDQGGWVETAVLTNPTLLTYDEFGGRLAFEGGSLFASSHSSTSVLRYDRGPAGWSQAERYITQAGLVWPITMELGFASNGTQVVLSDPQGATVFEREVPAELEVNCPGDPHPLSPFGLPVLLDARGELSLSEPTLPIFVVADSAVGTGVLFYGFGAASTPFSGTTLCVQGPLARAVAGPALTSSNFLTLELDLQSKPVSGGSKAILPGVDTYFQYWFRVPSAGTTFLSSSLRMVFAP